MSEQKLYALNFDEVYIAQIISTVGWEGYKRYNYFNRKGCFGELTKEELDEFIELLEKIERGLSKKSDRVPIVPIFAKN